MSEEHNWKFAQCFGDKGDSDDITDGNCSKLILEIWAHIAFFFVLHFVRNSTMN